MHQSDGPSAFLGVVEGQGVGQALPPGPRRARLPGRAGLVPLCDRLGEHASLEKGDLTGPNPVDRGKYGSKVHLITERTGLPISVGISAANLHDSQDLIPLVKGIPPIRSRRGPRRRKPASSTATRAAITPTCGDGYASAVSPTASPAGVSSPRGDWAVIAGPSNAPWPGSPAADASTDATNAKPTTSSPSPPSPAPSSATADSLADVGAQQSYRQVMGMEGGHVQGGTTVGICEVRIRAEGQQHGRGVHRQRLASLEGTIPLGIDRVRQQRHIAEDLIGIGTAGEQAGQGFRILVLNRVMGWCPEVTHQGIQQRSRRLYQRLSMLSVAN